MVTIASVHKKTVGNNNLRRTRYPWGNLARLEVYLGMPGEYLRCTWGKLYRFLIYF